MLETESRYPEAPVIRLSTHDEFMRALARLRTLKDADTGSVAGLEASALEIAITRYLNEVDDGQSASESSADRASP